MSAALIVGMFVGMQGIAFFAAAGRSINRRFRAVRATGRLLVMSTIAPTYLAQLDDQGCLAAAGSAFTPLGAAFGPSLVSLEMLYFPTYTAIGYVGVVLLLGSMLFFILSVRQRTVTITLSP